MTLFVGHLNEKIKDAALRELFEPYGAVVTIDRKGTYAFIEYAPGADNDRAVSDLNRKEILGSVIRVELSNRERGQSGPPPGDLSETCYNCQQIGHISKNCPLPAQPPHMPHWERIKQQQQQQQQHQYQLPMQKQHAQQSLYEQEAALGPPLTIHYQQSRLAKRGGMLDRNPGKIRLVGPHGHPHRMNAFHPFLGDGAGGPFKRDKGRGKGKYSADSYVHPPIQVPAPPTDLFAQPTSYQRYLTSLNAESVFPQPQWQPRNSGAYAEEAFGQLGLGAVDPRASGSRPPVCAPSHAAYHHHHPHFDPGKQGYSAPHQQGRGMGPVPGLMEASHAQNVHRIHGPEQVQQPQPPPADTPVYTAGRGSATMAAEGVPRMEYPPYMVPGTVMYVPLIAIPPGATLAQSVLLPQPFILPPGSPPRPLVAIPQSLDPTFQMPDLLHQGLAVATAEYVRTLPSIVEKTRSSLEERQPHNQHGQHGQPTSERWVQHEPGQSSAAERPGVAANKPLQAGGGMPRIEDKCDCGPPISYKAHERVEVLPFATDADGEEKPTSAASAKSRKDA